MILCIHPLFSVYLGLSGVESRLPTGVQCSSGIYRKQYNYCYQQVKVFASVYVHTVYFSTLVTHDHAELNSYHLIQDIGEPCIHLRIHKTDPVTKETTPITFSMSGDKFRLLLRGKIFVYCS